MLKLIIIDLDDTIINYSYAHSIAFAKLINAISIYSKLSEDLLIETYKSIKKNLHTTYDNKYTRHDKLLQIKLLCNTLKISNIKIITEFHNLYESEYVNNISLQSNCTEFLNFCKNNKIKVSIMTNNLLNIQMKVCNKLELYNYIDNLFTSNEFIYEKPHHESLKYILEYYNVNKDEVIIIGDSIECDIAFGKNNDIQTIYYDNKNSEIMFTKIIENIKSIYKCFK